MTLTSVRTKHTKDGLAIGPFAQLLHDAEVLADLRHPGADIRKSSSPLSLFVAVRSVFFASLGMSLAIEETRFYTRSLLSVRVGR